MFLVADVTASLTFDWKVSDSVFIHNGVRICKSIVKDTNPNICLDKIWLAGQDITKIEKV